VAEFDFAGWVARARAFTLGLGDLPAAEVRSSTVAAPLDEVDLRALEGALGRILPASLRAFFSRGTSAMDCNYIFKPEGQARDQLRTLLPDESGIFGGAKMGPASHLADYCKAAREWARDTWIADEPDQRIMWESALPFVALNSGDYLALGIQEDASDPPVVYLCHDDESLLLAQNLPAFLAAWERLCYLGPEHWLLGPFIGESGLDAESERAKGLRALLGQR
jgi:SMI1 / KNR4 family (SUKH-1)